MSIHKNDLGIFVRFTRAFILLFTGFVLYACSTPSEPITNLSAPTDAYLVFENLDSNLGQISIQVKPLDNIEVKQKSQNERNIKLTLSQLNNQSKALALSTLTTDQSAVKLTQLVPGNYLLEVKGYDSQNDATVMYQASQQITVQTKSNNQLCTASTSNLIAVNLERIESDVVVRIKIPADMDKSTEFVASIGDISGVMEKEDGNFQTTLSDVPSGSAVTVTIEGRDEFSNTNYQAQQTFALESSTKIITPTLTKVSSGSKFPIIGSFDLPKSGLINSKISLLALVRAGTSSNEKISKIVVNWGDGSVSNLTNNANPTVIEQSHVYATSELFTVTITAFNTAGLWTQKSLFVDIGKAGATAIPTKGKIELGLKSVPLFATKVVAILTPNPTLTTGRTQTYPVKKLRMTKVVDGQWVAKTKISTNVDYTVVYQVSAGTISFTDLNAPRAVKINSRYLYFDHEYKFATPDISKFPRAC